MTSLVNNFFNQSKVGEQGLMNGFIQECIQIKGHEYVYLPRTVQIENLVLGEDIVSKFNLAIPIEMYLADATGFTGDKEMFSKFGFEIRSGFKLVVHKDRWEQEIAANSVYLPPGTTYIRPREGDLVYDPLTKYLMEIKFVDHDVEFYSFGKNYQYYLSCEAFQYQNEEIKTGHADIDLFNNNSKDLLNNEVLAEDLLDKVVLEQGGSLLEEEGNAALPVREYKSTDYKPEATEIKLNIENPFA